MDKKLWLVDYVDDEGNDLWLMVVATDEADAKVRFEAEVRSLYGWEAEDKENEPDFEIVDFHLVDEVNGHKIIVQ